MSNVSPVPAPATKDQPAPQAPAVTTASGEAKAVRAITRIFAALPPDAQARVAAFVAAWWGEGA